MTTIFEWFGKKKDSSPKTTPEITLFTHIFTRNFFLLNFLKNYFLIILLTIKKFKFFLPNHAN